MCGAMIRVIVWESPGLQKPKAAWWHHPSDSRQEGLPQFHSTNAETKGQREGGWGLLSCSGALGCVNLPDLCLAYQMGGWCVPVCLPGVTGGGKDL